MNISLKVEMAFFLPKALHFSERFLITVYMFVVRYIHCGTHEAIWMQKFLALTEILLNFLRFSSLTNSMIQNYS